jgi:hypothetical protein
MLCGVFEGEPCGVVLIMLALSCDGESGEVAIEEGAVVVAGDSDGVRVVLNFKLVGLVLFGWEVAQLDEGGRLVGEADGVLPVAELEDQQADQHNRLHFERGYQIINGDGRSYALNQLALAPLYLLYKLFMGSSSF